MADHRVGTREEWRETREALLVREKEHTRLGDEQYAFETEDDGLQVRLRRHDEYGA